MKYCYHILVCLFILLAPTVKIQAQGSGDIYRVVKTSNGQTFLLNSKIAGDAIYTDISFRIGPVYEFDSLSGISLILSRVIGSHIEAELQSAGRPVKYHGTVEPEQVSFHFESSPADLDYTLNLINSKILEPDFNAEGAEEAKTEIRTDLDSMKNLESYKTETVIMKRVWSNDYKRLNGFGDQSTYVRITARDLMEFHKRYFLPFNNTVSILGTFSENEVLDKLQKTFKEFKSREFNPELITRVIDFKPVINTIQLVSKSIDKNIATITYQNPGARQDRGATYSAYVLTEMINDKDGNIQKAMKDAGLKDFKATYVCNNFYGTFTLSAQPADNKFFDAFTRMTQLMTDITGKDYFKPEDIEKAQKNIAVEYNDLKTNNTRAFMSLVTRYRFSNDENYFVSLSDSINGVTVDHMRRYVGDYFTDHSGVRDLALSGAAQDTASEQPYFPLDESISEVKFTYDLNKTEIETEEAKLNLKRVLEWLRVNSDMHVQINGFADQGEFTKAYDDTMMRFIDSTATFHKAMPDATKKGYLRIEMMRAMRIAKALYEAGISEDRISGTSMVFSSETKEAAAANRKCTLSFEKIKPRVSLYEYHFGKKKEEPPVGSK